MFLAYLQGIETVEELEDKYGNNLFLAYLQGIETLVGQDGRIAQMVGF